jgi:modulator of FtsH protease HflK
MGGRMDQFRPREDPNPVRDLERGLEDIRQFMRQFLGGNGGWLIGLAVIVLYLASGIYKVGPGEKGVVLLFGKVYSLTDPGLRYRLPKPFMSHTVVDVGGVRQATIGVRDERGPARSILPEALMLTGDENIVEVQLFVQYKVIDPVKFLFGAWQPEPVLKASAEVALRGVVGESTIDHTMTKGRLEIQSKVQAYLQRLLDNYDTGLLVEQARLLVVDTPAQVKEAFHDVVRALEDKERLINEAQGYREDVVPKARGQAQQEIREAEAYKAQRAIRAKGDAQRFTAVLQEYKRAPDVTRQRLYLESVEQFLPPTKKFIMEGGGGNTRALPLLPLVGGQDSVPVTSSRRPASETAADSKSK